MGLTRPALTAGSQECVGEILASVAAVMHAPQNQIFQRYVIIHFPGVMRLISHIRLQLYRRDDELTMPGPGNKTCEGLPAFLDLTEGQKSRAYLKTPARLNTM